MTSQDWDYERFPNHKDVLRQRSAELARELLRPKFDTVGRTSNTKPTHKRLFSGLTPELSPGFAGNYRGCELPELKYYRVTIRSDPRVGTLPEDVLSEITRLAIEIARGIAALDSQEKSRPRAEFLIVAIQFACLIFEAFLRIHPYANGNGHVARWMVWALLGRYRFWFRGFQIEPKPGPPYSDLIKAHRSGQRAGLESFLLSAVDPASMPANSVAQPSS